MSRARGKVPAPTGGEAGDTGVATLRPVASDHGEDLEFERELLKLSPSDRAVVGVMVRRIVQMEAEFGSEVADALLERLLGDLKRRSSVRS